MNSIGYITDGVDEKSKQTTSRSGGIVDDRAVGEGFFFELQDYTYGLIKKKYVGEKWYCSCTYDEAYEKFGGEIISHYRPWCQIISIECIDNFLLNLILRRSVYYSFKTVKNTM